MQKHRFVAVVLAAALLSASVPATVLAGDDRAPAVRPSLVSRAAIDRAVQATLAAPAPAPARAASVDRTRTIAPRARQGGGKSMMVMTIVGTLVGVGTTYYLLKEMKKNQNSGDQ
jgi:hypothetical protein